MHVCPRFMGDFALIRQLSGGGREKAWQPALAEIEDALVPAFIIEEFDGRYTVFVPSNPRRLLAPSTFSSAHGSILWMSRSPRRCRWSRGGDRALRSLLWPWRKRGKRPQSWRALQLRRELLAFSIHRPTHSLQTQLPLPTPSPTLRILRAGSKLRICLMLNLHATGRVRSPICVSNQFVAEYPLSCGHFAALDPRCWP